MTDELKPELLTDEGEHWFRQAEPSPTVDEDQASPLLFRLRENDHGKLSGARCTKQSAQGAFEEHRARGLKTTGTWALTVGEVAASGDPHGLDLRCFDDSMIPADPPRATGHTFVDFREVDPKPYKLARLTMVKYANQRGRVYAPPPAK